MKIFKPSELIEERFPQKSDIKTCYEQSQELIHKMVREKVVLGVTSYGSVPANTHSVCSDIDWVFLFQDHQKIFQSEDLKKIIQIHKSFHVEFSPPIATLDYIHESFHNLFVFQSMKVLKERFVAGLDPLLVYEENTFGLEYLNFIESYMQNFHKDCLEPLIYRLNYQDSFDDYIDCLETSVHSATQIQRFMILALFNAEGIENISAYIDRYYPLLRGLISNDMLKIGEEIQSFRNHYKQYINDFVTSPINMLSISKYKEFLMHFEPLISKSFEFCIQNLEVYKSTFSKSLNL